MMGFLSKLVNHVGDVAGGFLGRVTGTTAANAQQQYNYENQIQQRVADGLKAGINPLAAIGASTNYQPYFQSNMNGLSDISNMVNTVSGGANGLFKGMKGLFAGKVKDDIDYDTEVKQLDLEAKRLENRILSNQLRASEINLSGGTQRERPGLSKSIDSEQPNRLGDRPLFYPVYDLQGRPRLVVNQDVVEGDSDNAGYIASLKHAISQGFVNKITGEVNSDQYRMMLDDMYYNMTGRHIANLDKLYVSPAEVAIAAAELYGQVKGK